MLSGCGGNGLVAPEDLPAPVPPPAGPVEVPFHFATGVENSCPTLPDGRRVDELAKCGHYERWREDFGRLAELGVPTLRYGPPLYRTHPAAGRYDWSSTADQMEWLRANGITVIADLCHFGVPDWLGGFDDPDFPRQFAAYAGAFARRFPWVRYYTPVNEIYIAALFSSYHGWWNECRTGEAAFARALVNLCRAHELAVAAVLRERPDAIIVHVESAERYTAADGGPEAAAQAAFWSDVRFAALDLTLGRPPAPAVTDLLRRGGLTDADFAFFRTARAPSQRWLGLDYYATCEQTVDADGRRARADRRAGLAAVVRPYYDRYQRPVFLTETNRREPYAAEWLAEQWGEALLLRATGVPLCGFTWYGLTDSVDWKYLLREDRGEADPVGLVDLGRGVRPVGAAYAGLIAKWRPALAAPARRAVASR